MSARHVSVALFEACQCDPRGSLSTAISPDVIREMNEEVEEATVEGKKRGPYKMYSSSERSQIGKYASQHGTTAKETEENSESQRRCDVASFNEITDLPVMKRGRKLLIGEDLDQKVQLYLR